MRRLWRIAVALLVACPLSVAQKRDLQDMVVGLAPTASEAVIPIQVWENIVETDGQTHPDLLVVGTGFLIDKDGDFITAGHVVDALAEIQKDPKVRSANMSAMIAQRQGGGGSMPFKITDRDADHDIVLCHLPFVHGLTPLKATFINGGNVDTAHPYASLAVAVVPPVTGRFVLVSGYPVGSWTPAVQFGMVAATKNINPMGMYKGVIHKDGGELLQISVSANHGNSGGPVIDIESGKVIGVIDQFVPAPLQVGGKQILDAGTFSASGIMLAAPAKWVDALLEKNHIKSEGTVGGKWMLK
jgi:S1-C subfamily serine protease